MKIISVDNFDMETIGSSDDELVAENVSEYYVKVIVGTLNSYYSGDTASRFYKAVDNDYKLRVYEP